MNLLKIHLLHRLARSVYFPVLPQIFTLAVYLTLFFISASIRHDPATAELITTTNIAPQIIWNLWWPVTLILAAVAGRLWCAVCPLELVNSLASRVGLKLKAPALLMTGWIVTLFFAVILFGDHKYLNIFSSPRSLAVYLGLVLALAVVMGLLFEKRSFCSYICPLGSIMGLYAYIAGAQWRVTDSQLCRECETKDCVATQNRYKLSGHSCTSNLYPGGIHNNRECLLCTHCMTACPRSNLGFSLRLPLTDFFSNLRLIYPEMLILLLLIGFVNNNWRALVIFTLLPLFLCLLVERRSLSRMLNVFMVLLIPITAAAHTLHALRAIISNLPMYRYNITDPLGVRTAVMLSTKSLVIDRSWLAPLWNLYGITIWLLHGAAFAATVIIVLRSPLTQKIGRAGKALLILSAASYIASFYIKV